MQSLTARLRLCCLLAMAPGYAIAQIQPGDPAEGERVARTWCSNCHMVDPQGQSRASDATPSFAAIARMPSTTSASLHAFLMTTHPPMPDFRLSRGELDDVTAYILSLRRK